MGPRLTVDQYQGVRRSMRARLYKLETQTSQVWGENGKPPAQQWRCALRLPLDCWQHPDCCSEYFQFAMRVELIHFSRGVAC
jgi:hypothetical protein